jgi:GMP synthase (glutamine-hydrolysing)
LARALVIVHQPDAGPGVFADALNSRDVRLETWAPATLSGPPGDPAEYDAVFSFGGAMHADHEAEHPWLRQEKAWLASVLDGGVPVMGVCLGGQLLAEAAGAPARRAREPEIGWYPVEVTPEGQSDPVMGPLAPAFEAFQWHSYEVPLPPGATALARSEVCLQAYRLGELAWGIQFHAEVTPEDTEGWIDGYDKDPDAVRMGLDPEALRAQTRGLIGAWNEIGRGLCERFLDAAVIGRKPPE